MNQCHDCYRPRDACDACIYAKPQPKQPDMGLNLEAMAIILKAAWENGRVHGRQEATDEMVSKFKEIME